MTGEQSCLSLTGQSKNTSDEDKNADRGAELGARDVHVGLERRRALVGPVVDHSPRIGGIAQRFDRLVLVAPPKFLGALRKELHKEVEKLVAEELPKDLSWLNAREIERYFSKGSARAP